MIRSRMKSIRRNRKSHQVVGVNHVFSSNGMIGWYNLFLDQFTFLDYLHIEFTKTDRIDLVDILEF